MSAPISRWIARQKVSSKASEFFNIYNFYIQHFATLDLNTTRCSSVFRGLNFSDKQVYSIQVRVFLLSLNNKFFFHYFLHKDWIFQFLFGQKQFEHEHKAVNERKKIVWMLAVKNYKWECILWFSFHWLERTPERQGCFDSQFSHQRQPPFCVPTSTESVNSSQRNNQ